MNLALAIVGHMVGDYLLQNDWLAEGKKRSSLICALHCAIWVLSVCVATSCWIPWVIAFLFITHFAQDRTGFVRWYMVAIGQDKFASPPMAPWSIIVVDNVFHLVALAVIARSLA
ncbi:MAG: DUF3307 domain-containing protein [Anaerolineae bacterium]|nr:DUF3307 domain-containing protein [Phycisphaerae bacterium]